MPSPEPRVLLVGRSMDVLAVLVEELRRAGRDVRAANTEALIRSALSDRVDLVCVGAGLPDEVRNQLAAVVAEVDATIPVHMVQRTATSHPRHTIGFVHERAIDFKLAQVLPPGALPPR